MYIQRLRFKGLTHFSSCPQSTIYRYYDSGKVPPSSSSLDSREVADDVRLVRYLRERTLQDHIVLAMPYMVQIAAITVVACVVYDPSMKLLLYSAIPEQCQNWLSFLICLTEELRLLCMYAVLVVPTWQIQVMSFDLLNRELENIADAVRHTE